MVRKSSRQDGDRAVVSISDVARLAKTSAATVSRVLNGTQHPVASKTRKRVLEAVSALGYRPNSIAKALVTNSTNSIGLIVGDISDSFFAEIVRGVEETARTHGYLTIVCNSDRRPEVERTYFEMLVNQQAAAVILAGGVFADAPDTARLHAEIEREAQRGRCIIALSRRGAALPTIAVDDARVAYDLTRYLILLGHREIAFVSGPIGLSTSIMRQNGFIRAMKEANLDPSAIFRDGFGLDSGRRAAQTMMRGRLPEAVLAATDDTAFGLITTLRSAGVSIPHDISVVGIDDSRYSSFLDLTTGRIPSYEIGEMAARAVISFKATNEVQSIVVPHQLVIRGSTQPKTA